MDKPNIIVVMSDTLRAGDLGCYGGCAHTPHIDEFAAQSVKFTRCYPEGLPTIPVRRALHTGRRTYPFHNYRPVPWDIVYLPGWQPIGHEEDTLAETLATGGYQTGFVTDTLPYFAPGFNFTRGFWQWEYVRGQQQDRWKSPYSVPEDLLRRYNGNRNDPHSLVPMHLANTAHVKGEEDTSTARTFSWAMDFLDDNAQGQPFYLLVDCFDPHEPWEAPYDYYRMYGPKEYDGRRIVHCGYGPVERFGYTDEETGFVRAHYLGLVSLVDRWFGRLMNRLEERGLSETTAVFLISDHGTNFCDNPRRVIGKPADAMYPGVNHIPLLARVPGAAAGTCNELIYNIDLTATVYDLAGLESEQGIDGESLTPHLGKDGAWTGREYVTCRYGDSVCCVDETTWAMGDIHGTCTELFDLTADPGCMNDIRHTAGADRWNRAWDNIRADAGGELPDYSEAGRTDAIGQKPAK